VPAIHLSNFLSKSGNFRHQKSHKMWPGLSGQDLTISGVPLLFMLPSAAMSSNKPHQWIQENIRFHFST